MNISKKTSRVQGLKRFAGITRILAKHGLGDILDRTVFRGKLSNRASKANSVYLSPHRLRLVLEDLGPSFIKLGQLMSTRADLFPPEYIDELKKLQDRIPPIPFEEIRSVVEGELGQPLSEIFVDFIEESLAAASVAQVHLAQLKTGEKVAVKVIRPGIEKAGPEILKNQS